MICGLEAGWVDRRAALSGYECDLAVNKDTKLDMKWVGRVGLCWWQSSVLILCGNELSFGLRCWIRVSFGFGTLGSTR